MNASIVPQLVRKDLCIMKNLTMYWWLGGVASVAAVAAIGSRVFIFGMILFVACLLGAGMHAVMRTVVEERREQTLPFIMSLPITIREYTAAKLIANLVLFSFVWVTLSVASLVVFLTRGGLPSGAIPFVTIVMVGIFLAFICVLATSLITESIGWSIGSTVWANLGSQVYLWWVSDLSGIKTVIGGNQAIWNGTALGVLGGQLGVILVLIALTFLFQSRKTDFI